MPALLCQCVCLYPHQAILHHPRTLPLARHVILSWVESFLYGAYSRTLFLFPPDFRDGVAPSWPTDITEEVYFSSQAMQLHTEGVHHRTSAGTGPVFPKVARVTTLGYCCLSSQLPNECITLCTSRILEVTALGLKDNRKESHRDTRRTEADVVVSRRACKMRSLTYGSISSDRHFSCLLG